MNPTTVLALIGGIVWGIQLNMAVVDHTGRIGAINGRLDAHQLLLQEQSTNMARTSVILSNIEERISDVQNDVHNIIEKTNRTSQRVTENATKLQTMSHRHDNNQGYQRNDWNKQGNQKQ